MIIGKLAIDDRETMLIGLSRRNVELLLEGKPIYKHLGAPCDILIVGGEDEQSILEELKRSFRLPEDKIALEVNGGN